MFGVACSPVYTRRDMPKTRVKICGITCLEDAMLAVNAGADAIGLIFHPPAARGISVPAAEQIVAAIPPFVTPVGLFLDTPPQSIIATASRVGIRLIQLHGHELPSDLKLIAQYPVIKAIHVKPGKLMDSLAPWKQAVAEGLTNLKGLVLETGWAAAQGGTGIENDWEQIREVQETGGFEGLPPIILAGGLRPSSVTGVIETLRPWAVDVSSGVEEIKGRKSALRLEEFMRAVRLADHNCRHIPTA